MVRQFTTLNTSRLKLRKPLMSDAPELAILRSTEVVNRYIDRPDIITEKEAENILLSLIRGIEKGDWAYWAITEKNSHELIGTVCLWKINAHTGTVELGYELMPRFHNLGYMSEVLTPVLEFARKNVDVPTVEAYTHENNAASIALLKKFGFQECARDARKGGHFDIIFSKPLKKVFQG